MSRDIASNLAAEHGDEYSGTQLRAVEAVIENKLDADRPGGAIDLEPGPEAVVVVRFDGETYYADPDNEYCMTHGVRAGNAPPEAETTDGRGETEYGVR
ncbi:hypothetical protein [Halosimplex pelagicum]|uniref:Halobacterial output domain-containing protein n=1 Tax=Halosimplex pelagicum TaxID=869886 RepID=A0A7D5TFX2_9EURY|nr:hypothetical protein [Halosimplex pelagicum]QLH80936.1 hypothetical protein HZS54_04470 [Halosimplex pelagicum]